MKIKKWVISAYKERIIEEKTVCLSSVIDAEDSAKVQSDSLHRTQIQMHMFFTPAIINYGKAGSY